MWELDIFLGNFEYNLEYCSYYWKILASGMTRCKRSVLTDASSQLGLHVNV